ncbi:MAG: SLC13/DASS family transporter [Clostridiales bacterium]|nr:SLC13/DASS family transporter [Clostridiales bacterium]
MGIIDTWQQAAAWLVLIAVFYSVLSGKIRYDITAFAGLLLLGVLGIRKPGEIFSGFSSPALFTIAIVLVMSAGIVESGLLTGLGKKIAGKIHTTHFQVLALFLTTGFISAFMNNVGAVGITLPTAKRMAQRAKVPKSSFGIPILFASILGGSITLIGTASNLIVSTYRLSAFGKPFVMFDFAPHGLSLLISGVFVLFICRVCGFKPMEKTVSGMGTQTAGDDAQTEEAVARNRKKSLTVAITLIPAIVLSAVGILHPALAFGIITIVWVFSGVLSYKSALEHINVSIIIFLGSMIGITGVLEHTGALQALVNAISPAFTSLPPFFLILTFVLVSTVFCNLLDNTVAAVLLAPSAVALWRTGAVNVNPDALLMAVAAGASLGIVIPTHQATIVVMNSMDFPKKRFISTGAFITLIAIALSSVVIYAVWR